MIPAADTEALSVCGLGSMMVTLAPDADKKYAAAEPTMPEPIMTTSVFSSITFLAF